MKLFIDTGEGDAAPIHPGYCSPEIVDDAVTLPVPLARQEKDNWCWAAIAQAMARYFKLGEWPQAGVAAACGSRAADSNGAGDALPLHAALDVVGCGYYWTPGKPSWQRLMFAINQGLPVCARIQWRGGAAHFVVIHGYWPDRSALLVADSIVGGSEQDYRTFPKPYNGQHGVWTETYWTLRPGEAQ